MTTSVSERRAPAPPAAFIVDAVGDVGRPTAGLPSCKDIEHLPGEGGMFSGITNMIGWARHGNAHLVDQQKRYGRIYRTKFGFEPLLLN